MDLSSEVLLELLGEEIRIRRKRAKMYRFELAAKAGCSCSHLQSVEKGRTSVGMCILISICRALETDLAEILQACRPKRMKKNGAV